MSSPRASIIIRCYNEQEHIGKLLHGIFEQNMDHFEVLLVDSGSTDGTVETAKKYPIEDIVRISPEDFSFGRALNYGCRDASGEFFIFASAHVYPIRDDWLEQLLSTFKDDDIALVYGKQRGNETTKYSEKRIFRRWFPDEPVRYQDSPFCNNANAAIRAAVWDDIKYDEELTGLEDLDWAKRAQQQGWEISYAPNAEIIHVHDETPTEVRNRYRREAIAHKHIMDDREFTIWTFLRLFLYNTVSDYIAAADEGVLWDTIISIPRFRLMQFWGTYQGFNQDSPVSERLWRRFYYPDRSDYPDLGAGDNAEGDSGDLGDTIDYSTRSIKRDRHVEADGE